MTVTTSPSSTRQAGPATAVFRPAGSSGADTTPQAVPRPLPWVLGSVGAAAVVALGGWFLVLSPQASATADVRDQTTQAEDTEALLTTKVAQLRTQFADLPQTQAELAQARLRLPTEPALAQLLRGLRDAAATSGVTLTGVAPSAPAVAEPAAAVDPAADPAATTDAAAPADGAATTATTATTTATTTTATVDPATGLVEIPLTITATGTYAALETFLAAVQQQDRLVLVDSVALATASSATGQNLLTLTVSGQVFALPDATADSAPTAAATAAG